MGAAESKLAFKNKVFKLALSKDELNTEFIPMEDSFWNMFWDEPTSAQDIFNLLTSNDIKSIRDSNKVNFLNLIRILSIKLISLTNNYSKDSSSTRKLLNCIRCLNRLIPFLFDKQDWVKDINNLFWNLTYNNIGNQYNLDTSNATIGTFSSNSNDSSLTNSSLKVNIDLKLNSSPSSTHVQIDNVKAFESLGYQLINSLIDLLFMRNFSLESNGIKGLDFKIWEVGIGSNGKYQPPNPKLDSNRLEVLRLLITLSSQTLYHTSKTVTSKGSRFLTVLVSSLPRLKLLTLICSLLNTVCRSCKDDSIENGLKYDDTNGQYSNVKYSLLRETNITLSLQLLTILLVYPIPNDDIKFLYDCNILKDSGKPHNLIRSSLGKLHKENELNFIYQSIIGLLKKPLEKAVANEASPFNILKTNFSSNSSSDINQSSSAPGPSSPTPSSPLASSSSSSSSSFPTLSSWSIELLILLWELIQCNKSFKTFVYTKKTPEITIILLYYIKFYKNNEKWRPNLIRIIVYFLLYLTSDELVLSKLLSPFNQNYYHKNLPMFFRLNNLNNINNLTYRDFIIIHISNMLTNDEFDTIITPNLFEYLYNLIPITKSDPKVKAVLSYHSSLSIMSVINHYNNPLSLSNHLKLDLLALLIRSITHLISKNLENSRTLLFVLVKNEKILTSLLTRIENTTLNYELERIKEEDENDDKDNETNNSIVNSEIENDYPNQDDPFDPLSKTTNNDTNDNNENNNEEEDELKDISKDTEFLRPKLPSGMSIKAKSKLPIDAPLKKIWAGYKALIIILKIIKLIKEEIPGLNSIVNKSEIIESLLKIEKISKYHEKVSQFTTNEFHFLIKFEPLKFTWSELSLGWYESILFGNVLYENLNLVKNSQSNTNTWFNNRSSSISFKDVASSWGFNWKSSTVPSNVTPSFNFDISILNLDIWTGSNIKLFKLKKSKIDKPLVDVNSLMKRFRLNSSSSLNTLDSKNSYNRNNSITNSPNQLTPINSRQSFASTPRNSIHGISRQGSFTS